MISDIDLATALQIAGWFMIGITIGFVVLVHTVLAP